LAVVAVPSGAKGGGGGGPRAAATGGAAFPAAAATTGRGELERFGEPGERRFSFSSIDIEDGARSRSSCWVVAKFLFSSSPAPSPFSFPPPMLIAWTRGSRARGDKEGGRRVAAAAAAAAVVAVIVVVAS